MGRTLLLSTPETSWREWLKEQRGKRDLICLDPADPSQTPPGKLTLWSGNKPVYWRFYGSLDPGRAPHVLIAALAHMLPMAKDDALVQLFATRNTPLFRQVSTLVAQLVQPSEILVPKGCDLDLEGYPVGPEEVELEPAFPAMVQQAQRKAQWMKLVEGCTDHTVELRKVAIEGARLGSGKRLHPDDVAKAGLTGVTYAELCGGTLLLVAPEEPEEQAMSRALDHFHASRASIVDPAVYENLLCSFARQSGEDFGIGIVQCVDFVKGVAKIACTAVAPAPVRILRIGGLRVDLTGKELGDAKPWQV